MLNNGQLTSPIISCEWLHQNKSLEHLIILDCSVNKDTVYKTYIPNSRCCDIKSKFSDINGKFPNSIPSLEQFEREVRSLGISNNSIIIVYDDNGLYWSPRVWWLFQTFGFENVAVLDGGLPEWKRLGYETSSDRVVSHWERGDFSAHYIEGRMYSFEDVLELSGDKNVMILDARSSDRFQCVKPEPRVGLRSGTIPNSKNLPYTILLDEYCLKPKSELQSIFDTFEISNHRLVFSCGSGITACILALSATVCGYKQITVYDGSWTEYGTLTA